MVKSRFSHGATPTYEFQHSGSTTSCERAATARAMAASAATKLSIFLAETASWHSPTRNLIVQYQRNL